MSPHASILTKLSWEYWVRVLIFSITCKSRTHVFLLNQRALSPTLFFLKSFAQGKSE